MKNCVSKNYTNINTVRHNKIFKYQQIIIKLCYILRIAKLNKQGGGEWDLKGFEGRKISVHFRKESK